MSEVKISDVLMSAVELLLSRCGDIDLEDGSFAMCGTDEIIRLDTSIASFLELPSDDVHIRDIDLILRKAKSYDANQKLIDKQAARIDGQLKMIEVAGRRIQGLESEVEKQVADIKLLREALEALKDAADHVMDDSLILIMSDETELDSEGVANLVDAALAATNQDIVG